ERVFKLTGMRIAKGVVKAEREATASAPKTAAQKALQDNLESNGIQYETSSNGMAPVRIKPDAMADNEYQRMAAKLEKDGWQLKIAEHKDYRAGAEADYEEKTVTIYNGAKADMRSPEMIGKAWHEVDHVL